MRDLLCSKRFVSYLLAASHLRFTLFSSSSGVSTDGTSCTSGPEKKIHTVKRKLAFSHRRKKMKQHYNEL
jgi:hypothetical protein